ncbi:MAG: carboxymuconolactone decarboxylase family protein [Terriglobia bacterium]
MSEEQIAALNRDDWEAAGVFDERARAVIRLAEKLTRAPGSVTDDDIKKLRKWFGESHLVELALIIGTMNLTNRFNLCFDVELEKTETSRR